MILIKRGINSEDHRALYLDNLNVIYMLDTKEKFALLVVSCDNYSDLWQPFFHLFWRFWPDCPFNVYLLTNTLNPKIQQVKNLLIGDDISWSENLLGAIKQLKEDYVFLFLDDLFLYDYVKTDEVLQLFYWIAESNANYVRMFPYPKPDKQYNGLVGVLSKGTIYRASTVLSVWKKDVLKDLLKNGESAWEFEINGTVRSDKFGDFYSTYKNYFSVINGVIKGKWQRSAVKLLRELDAEIELNRREVMSLSETITFYFKRQRLNLLNLLPAKYRRNVKNFILRGKYIYKTKT